MKISASILASVLLASATGMAIPATPELVARDVSMDSVVPNKYIVVLKSDLDDDAVENHMKKINKKQITVKGAQLKAFSKNSGIVDEFMLSEDMRGYTGYFAPETVEMLKKLEDVELIEPDRVVKTNKIHEDSSASWGLKRLSTRNAVDGYRPFEYYYDTEGGSDVTAYIIDSGIFTRHKQFQGRATWGATFAGFGDYDGTGHGSHVAGIVGGKLFGVARKTNLVAVRVVDDYSHGTAMDIIKGIEWAVKDANRKREKPGFKGAVANVSLGIPKSEILNKVINDAAKSLIISVAAGNAGDDACKYSPASAEGAITVGSSDIHDTVVASSNYGKCVDIYAPGSQIMSVGIGSVDDEKIMSGTSMAAPHITGLAAYFLSLQPDSGSDFSGSTISTAQMKKALIAFGTKGALYSLPPQSPNVLPYNGAGGDLSEFYAALHSASSS